MHILTKWQYWCEFQLTGQYQKLKLVNKITVAVSFSKEIRPNQHCTRSVNYSDKHYT